MAKSPAISTHQHQFSYSVRRWLWLQLYALAGLLLGIPLGNWIQQVLREMLLKGDKFGAAGPLFFYGIIALLLLCALFASGYRTRHLRHLLAYPPFLAAVPLAWINFLIVALLWVSFVPTPRQQLIWPFAWATLVFGIFLVGALSVDWRSNERKKPADELAPPPSAPSRLSDLLNLPIEQLRDWLANEAPIISSQADWMNSRHRAQRIWAALQTRRESTNGRVLRKTAVVQGTFGSGKSSLVHLVKELSESADEPFYIFVEVNCWGFSSQRAQEHILEQAIDALSEHVDCTSVRKLPAAYADALSSTNHWFKVITHLFGREASPVGQLQQLTPILSSIGAQLVIVVEDTDRNGPDFDQKHIEAMLYNFRAVEGVSFILTAGGKSEIEFPKIAEHIEFLPPLREELVLSLVDKVRDYCRSHWGDIDPVVTDGHPQNRPKCLREAAMGDSFASVMFDRRTISWPTAIARLLQTPRALKAFLNTILSRWESLHGEVDIDEFIMVSALRLAAPGAFSFLSVHFDELSLLGRRRSNSLNLQEDQDNRDLSNLQNRWKRVTETSDGDPAACEVILHELFPSSGAVTGFHSYSHGNRVQSLRSERRNIYWERLGAEAYEGGAVRDQEVLIALREAQIEPVGIRTLADKIVTFDSFGEIVLFFDETTRSTPPATILSIASVIMERLRQSVGPKSARDMTAYQVAVHWVCRRCGHEQVITWATHEITLCIPRNLKFASELYFGIVRDSHGTGDEQRNARLAMVHAARSSIPSLPPEEFAACFDADFAYTLRYLLILDSKEYPEDFKTYPAEWAWLGPALLDALRTVPRTMAPQVIHAFGEYGPSGEAFTHYRFVEHRLVGVFGAATEEVLRLILREFDVSPALDGNSQRLIPMAKREAERLLRDGFSPTPPTSETPLEQ